MDAFRAYFAYELVPGHEKGFFYYMDLLAGWGGMETGLVLIFSVGLAGGLAVQRFRENPLVWCVAGFSLVQFLVYSILDYKTPWLILGVLPGFCLLGGAGFLFWSDVPTRFRAWRVPARFLGAVAILWSAGTAYRAAFKDPAGEAGTNGYAYVHTLPDVPALAAQVKGMAGSRYADQTRMKIQAYGFETWPFPWYFRGFPRAVFSTERPDELDAPIVIYTPDPATGMEIEIFSLDYRIDVATLRPGVPFVVYTLREDD